MSKHTALPVVLIALCIPSILLTSCAVEVVEGPVTVAGPTATSAAPTRTPTHTPTPNSPPDSAPTPTKPLPVTSGLVEHTVQPGDTLLGLATTYDVPMAAIQLQNGMGDSTVVQVGQVLAIPPRAGWEGASRFWVVHVVEAGETLVGIARNYGLKAETIETANGLTDADLIVIGQELVLPLDAPAVTQASTPVHIPTPSLPAPSPPHPTAASPTASPAPTAAPPPADVSAWPHETARLINEVRARHGLGPLAYNETLALAAQAHANDCARRGWCSHTGSDGSDIKTRILRAGYDPAGWAECWAQRQTPQGAVDIWMDEVPPNDPHRRTLLTTWLSEIGVGVAQTSWGYYFIADFGRP